MKLHGWWLMVIRQTEAEVSDKQKNLCDPRSAKRAAVSMEIKPERASCVQTDRQTNGWTARAADEKIKTNEWTEGKKRRNLAADGQEVRVSFNDRHRKLSDRHGEQSDEERWTER